MANLFVSFQVAVDGNGLAMPGAKLYFYQTGTNTPQDTWSSSSLTNPFLNSNPVVADSNGLWPPIYLGGALDYKAILKTSADVTVATRDPLLIDLTPASQPPARSILAGLALSTAGGSGTFGVAVGAAADSTNVSLLSLASAYTKTTAAWGLGSGNGGLDTGAIANATWYSVYIIQRIDTSVTDILFSLSTTTPTLPTNYTLFRRIGSMKTDGSAHWVAFTQTGDTFLWAVEANDVAAASQADGTTITLSTPTGLATEALFGAATNSGADVRYLLYCGSLATITFATGHSNGQGLVGSPGNGGAGQYRVFTDTASKIKFASNAAVSPFYIWTSGWIDRRGKDA